MSDLTISADALPAGYFNASGSTAELRIAAKNGFRNSAGTYVPAGDIEDRTSCLVLKSCTVNIDKSLSIPTVTELFTTIDSEDRPNVQLIAGIFSEDGLLALPWPSEKLSQGFRIQPSLAPSTTWEQICLTQGTALVNPPPYYVSLDELTRFGDGRWGSRNHASSSVEGTTFLSTDPANPLIPIAVGTNDPRVPTQSENDALVGTSGTPSSSNKYVTNADTRIPTQNENDALQGTSGSPSNSNRYVTNADPRIPVSGIATINLGVAVVNNALASVNAKILVTSRSPNVTGTLYCDPTEVTPSVAFVIRTTNFGDAGDVSWQIVA